MTASEPDRPSVLPVYLIHYNASEWCASAAASLLASEGIDVQVAVVDNGQTHGPPVASVLPPAVRLVRASSNGGYAGGANIGLADFRDRHPQSEFCVIASHDLHVETDTLRHLVDTAHDHPDFGIVAPALVAPEPAGGGVWRRGQSRQYPPDFALDVVERDWASGTCLVIRRACVESVGLFDARLGSYVEDVDYGLRARDAGWKVVVVNSARARGLGSANESVRRMRIANTILLNAKRDGARGAASSAGRYAGQLVRSTVAAVAPWRTAELRGTSRTFVRAASGALAALLFDGRVRRILRNPDEFSASDVPRAAGRTASSSSSR